MTEGDFAIIKNGKTIIFYTYGGFGDELAKEILPFQSFRNLKSWICKQKDYVNPNELWIVNEPYIPYGVLVAIDVDKKLYYDRFGAAERVLEKRKNWRRGKFVLAPLEVKE